MRISLPRWTSRLFAKAAGHYFSSDWTYSLTGAIVVLGLTFYPLLMLATEAAAQRVDARLEDRRYSQPVRVECSGEFTLPLIGPPLQLRYKRLHYRWRNRAEIAYDPSNQGSLRGFT